MDSKFGFAASTTKAKPRRSNDPELTITSTNAKFKLNEAATEAIGVKHGDYVILTSTEAQILEHAAAEGIKGEELEALKAEHLAYGIALVPAESGEVGAKVASNSKKKVVGSIVEFNDATTYSKLGGNNELNIIYSVGKVKDEEGNLVPFVQEGVELNVDGVEMTVDVYPITFSKEVAKLARGKKKDDDIDADEIGM